jgi:hypothetical protein
MPGSMTEFLASFKTDLARPARFDVQIPVPLKLIMYRNLGERLSFRCENAELPSRTFATTERKIYGPTEKHPYLTTYNESTFTFMVSDDMMEKKFFDAWMNLINPKSTFNLAYKMDYATPITVNQYDVSGKKSYSITMIDAFPISVNQLDLDWSNESSHHKLSVTFAYHTWEVNTIEEFVMDLVNAGVSTGVDIATQALDTFVAGSSFNPFKDNPSSKQIYSMQSIAAGMGELKEGDTNKDYFSY